MNTAEYLGKPQGNFSGDARWYKLDPPMKRIEYSWSDEPDKEIPVEYVIVSATNVPFSGPETYIFQADDQGNIISWADLDGSFQGELNHKKALTNAGYKIKEKVNG